MDIERQVLRCPRCAVLLYVDDTKLLYTTKRLILYHYEMYVQLLLYSPKYTQNRSKLGPRHDAPSMVDRGYARSSFWITTTRRLALLCVVYGDWGPVSAFSSVHAVATRKWQIHTDQYHPSKTILSYRSQTLLRVSPRALTLTQPYTPRLGALGGTSGLRTLDGLKHRSANFVQKLGSASEGRKEEEAELSTHTADSTASSGCSLPVHI